MGCTASTLNTPKNCLSIAQILESHDFRIKKKLDCESLDCQEEKNNFCGSPISINNNKEQDELNHRDNKVSSLNLQQSSSDANGKETNLSDDEGQGGDVDSAILVRNLFPYKSLNLLYRTYHRYINVTLSALVFSN